MPSLLEFSCPRCKKHNPAKVVDSWWYGFVFVRKRRCLECRKLFLTYERVGLAPGEDRRRGRARAPTRACLQCGGAGELEFEHEGQVTKIDCTACKPQHRHGG